MQQCKIWTLISGTLQPKDLEAGGLVLLLILNVPFFSYNVFTKWKYTNKPFGPSPLCQALLLRREGWYVPGSGLFSSSSWGLSFVVLLSVLFISAGFVYGAKDKKKLKVFIDDVNLPVPDDYDVQRCNEVSFVIFLPIDFKIYFFPKLLYYSFKNNCSVFQKICDTVL